MITGMNHAVLYVRDARRQQAFYTDVLGFEIVIADPGGSFVFMRAPGSANHHDLAFFTIGSGEGDSHPGRSQVGLYHLAWEVPTLDDLELHRQRRGRRSATEHRTTASTRPLRPRPRRHRVRGDGLVPESEWGDEQHQAIVRPLDVAADIARYGGERVSGVRPESTVGS